MGADSKLRVMDQDSITTLIISTVLLTVGTTATGVFSSWAFTTLFLAAVAAWIARLVAQLRDSKSK